MKEVTMRHLGGLDLHSNNVCGVVIDEQERWVLKRKFINNLDSILYGLEPYKPTLSAIGVEATYNWYWLVDGLMEHGYNVHLAHPGGIEGRSGKKHTNDFYDAFHLAHLLRIGNFPESYIYPKQERPVRDLLRKRSMLVKNKTQHVTSLINMVNRNSGCSLSSNEVKKLSEEELERFLEHEYLLLSGQTDISVIRCFDAEIKKLENRILEKCRLKPQFKQLSTVPGIGDVIASTICFEIGELSRFDTVGNYVSYCRMSDSECISNKKKKGENNRKNGNRYLCWAYIEAANFAKRFCPYAQVYYKQKLKESGMTAVATKSLASKLARATFHMMVRNEPYNPEKSFKNFSAKARNVKLPKRSRVSKS